MRTSTRFLAAVSGTTLAVILLGCCSGPIMEPTKTHSKASPDLQAKQLAAVNSAMAEGWLDKVEGGSVPVAWVGGRFAALSFEDKNVIIGVAYAYAWAVDPADPPRAADNWAVILVKNRNGKVIGRYGPLYGGLDLD